ncbi:MAG TPA: phospholipase D-like domain-containing protein [Stellaceae bacterium]|nr:phospholipase D-like domain-containing protein [Stellaceae bacterium]
MPFQIETPVTCYLLPEDGESAEQEFLANLKDPGETWIIAYSFTLVPMIDDLIEAHENHVPLHLYLDHSQSAGKAAKPVIQKLVDAGIEVTIGTSPEGSRYICHTKGMVSDKTPDGKGNLFCWEGSVNFSQSAWHQVNTAMTFSSPKWRDEFVAQFEALRQFAWTHEADMQLMSAPPPGLSAPTSSETKQKRFDLHPIKPKQATRQHAQA